MDFRKAVEILSGKKSVEQNLSNGSNSITTRMITGEVVSKSEDGKVTVDIGGFSVPGDDDSYIVLDTIGGLEEGDTVNILLTGRDGYGLTPFAIGGTGTVDRLATRVTIAEEAGEIAKANNQHFWTDDNGAHVTDDTSDSWSTEYAKTNHGELSNPTDAKPWHNIILNALGILLRRGLLNLVSISKTAIAFYDGTGNSSDNITASFGGNGAIIGKTSDRHVVIGTDGLSVYNSDGTLAPVNSTFDGQNIDSASISGSKIDFSTFQNGSISGAAIDTSTFVDGTISGSAIDTSTFTNGSISGSAIDTSTFTNGSISGSKINASTFADGAISGSKINASTFADGAISGSKIDSSTLTNIPYASIADADIAVASVANAQIANATIHQAQVENLSSDYAHITNGAIDNAKISHADVNGLNANYAHITNGAIDNAKIGHADVNGLNANYAHITNGEIDNAKIGYADVNGLNANYAQINMANVNNGWIQNGTIKNAAIKSQMVESISASQLTAGTIDADEITVQNLKASSLTVQTADGYVYVGEKRIPTKEFLDSLKDELQAEIDGAIETFTVSAIPTLNNTPANEWVVSGDTEATRKLRAKHVGDIAYVINEGSSANGHCYRFAYDNTTQTFSWVLIQDSDVTSALSRISDLETFESNTTSWIEETDEGLTTIRQNHTTLSGKVDKTVVETKQLWYTKSNTTAPTKPNSTTFPNGVTSTSTAGNAWTTVVPAYSASYPNYYYCLQYKLVDGSFAWSDVVRDIAMGESQQQGRKGVADAATAQTTANSNIKSSVQLWFTKADTTAPDKPTAQVTTNSASTVNAWNLAIPTYNSSYPNYFSCYQQQKGNGTWQWTDVVFDRSITEAQAKSQAALPSSEFTTFQSTTFKNLVDEVDEQSSTITQLSNSVSSVGNILTGNVANPSNWIVSAPSGASYTKEAYGTAGVKVTFNAVSGWEWLYSQPIAVTSGNKYMVFFDYTVGKEYTTRSGSGGYGLAAYSGSTIPGSQVDDANTRFLGKAVFPKTASGDRVLKGSFIFTATSDSIVLGLNGGHIADNQTGLSFTIDNLVVGETLSTTSNTVNSVKQTADANYQHLTNLTTTLGTNADGTSKSEDIVHKYNQLDQTLEGTISRVGETEASLITISNQNLSPFYSHPLDDINNATDNPNGYWGSNQTVTGCTSLADGWTHYEKTNTTSSTTWLQVYESASWRNAHGGLKGDTKYTVLLEFRNVTKSGNIVATGMTMHATSNPSMFVDNTTSMPVINGVQYHIGTTVSDTTASGIKVSTRTLITVPAGASISCDFRVSLYEGEYDGPYKPYVDQSLITRMSSAETSIDQNATAITLRATKEESYQMGQPNLVPWFSAGVPQLPSTYWKYGSGTASSMLQMTDMGDGWCRMVIDNTSGTGVVRYDYDPVAAEGIELGKDYTFLFEFRNISQSTGANTQVYAVQAGTYGMQFWGNYAQKVLQGTGVNCTTYLVQTIDQSGGSRADLCDDGVYRKRIVRKSEASDSSYWTRSNDKRCVRLVAYCDAGGMFDAEFRFSIYEGEYTGPYKPYSGTKLYASQAELKVANDRITSEVSARETLGQTVASHSTAIEQNASNITLSSKRMETIDGNMLYDVDAPSLAIVNGPSVRYFSDAGNSSFMVCDIREITNAPTAGINYMAHWSVSGSSEGKARGLCFYGQSHVQFISGQKYTLSCWVRCTSGKFTYYNTSYSGSFPSNAGARTIDSSLDSSWQFVTTTVTATKTTLDRVYFSAKTLSDSLSFECDMCGFKLTAAAYATQAELKVANDNINLRVEKNDVISQINLSTEDATISASKVNIEGAAIFTSGRLSDSSLASVRLTLTRNNWTDAGWAVYEVIGRADNWNNNHVAKGGTTSATGFASNTLRVGDLVVIEGVSTNTGNTHRVTVKVTQVPSGAGSSIPATTVNAVNSNSIADNIQVGGRNLLLNTSDQWSEWITPTTNTNNLTKYWFMSKNGELSTWASIGQDVSCSFEIEFSGVTASTSGSFRVYSQDCFCSVANGTLDGSNKAGWNDGAAIRGDNAMNYTTAPADGVYRFKNTVAFAANHTSQYALAFSIRCDYWGSGKYRIRNVKYELGNKPTDWSPAPEDQTVYVGSRNLLPGTQDWSGANKRTNGTYTVTSSTYGGCSVMTQVWGSGNCDLGYDSNIWTQPLEADTWYTLSFWAKASANIDSWSYFFSPSTIDKGINSSGNIVTSADGQSRNTITTNWQRIWTSWHIKADATSFPQQMILTRLQTQHSGVTVYIAGAKLEKGNKPTDWSPAPEDVAADISAVSTVANNAAPKTNAIKRTQRIYYRSSSNSKPTNMPTAWVTEIDDKWSGNNTTASNWTTKVTPISNGTGSSVTKYLYLWTCEQYELASGTVGYTNVLLDDATTVIDGGKIITGSVTANQLSANAVTAEKIAAGAITIGSVDGLQSALNGKETAGLVGIRLTLTRDNWTDTDWAGREVSGYTGSYTNAHTAKGGSTSATGFASNTLRVNDLVIIEGISTDTGNTHRFTIRVTSVPANATATIPGETVSSVNSVTMLDNINVGARNLLRWTNTQVDGDTWNKAADVSGTYGWYRYTSAITVSITNDGMKFTHSSASTRSGVVMYLSEPNAVVGEENVILSFDYRTNMTTLYSPYLLVAESGNSQHSTSMTCTKSETNWVHGSWKLNFPSTEGKTVVALLFAYVNTNGGWIEIKRGTLKLEKGSKETDWTPAIEDLTVLSEYNNLLLDTDTWGDKLWYDSAGAVINGDTVTYAANNTGNRMALIPCSSGQIFTLSYDIKASANITYGDSGGSILVDFVSSTTTYNRVSYFTPAKNSSVETEWKRVAYTFAVPYNDTIKALTVGLRNMSPSVSCTLYFRHVKLAIGDKTTEWSPANEQSVKRTQRIYYRTSSDTRPTDAATPTTWVTQNGNKWSATNTSLVNWTTKVTPISDGTGSNVTKCLYLWTCQQFEFVDGTVSHSPVLLDDSTTVIDGAKIITGSVSANSLNADEVKTQIVQTTNLSADKITSGDISADRIKTNVISAINSLTAGTINGARINAEQIQIGGSSLATQSDINNIQVGVTNLLKKSHNINLCFNSTSKVASIEGGKSDPDGGSNAYLITPTSGQTGWYAGPSSANCILKNLEVSYTFSVWLRADTATQCKLCCRYMDSTPYSSTATRAVMNITTSWQRFYISAPLKQAQATDSVWIGQVTDTPIYVYHPKVEVGTKPSDWSPAPEDIDASIDSVQSDLDMSRSWYAECPTAAGTTAKVATITPTTTSFTTETLTPGTIVHVKFAATNSGSAGSLTLNVNGTGAKPIKYVASGGSIANIPGNGYLIINNTYEFYYDGTNWVVQMPYNTNNYDRENYKAAVAASAAISAGRIAVFGTDHKLKTLAASAFDVSCPILYVATEYKAADVTNGTARNTNYTFWGSTFTLTNTHSIQGAAAGKPVFIVGKLNGTIFTPNATVLTCTIPTTAEAADNNVYLRLGLMSTATAAVLESDHPMYMFFDGKFQQCDPATASAACSATNHISMTGSGIKIANANPSSATTYQLQTSTGTDFVVAGSVMNRINGNGMTLYDGSGTDEDENVVAKFAGNLIELGKNRENTVIRCAENLELSYYHDNNGVRYGNLYSEAQIRMWSGYEDTSVPINQHAEVSAYAQQGEYQAMLKSVKMSQSANASNKVASIASVVGDSGNSRIEARINDDPNDSNGSFIFDKNGFTINGGTPIKAFYAGTDAFTLNNGQWMQLKSAQQVSTLLGSGASLANTICIAQNGDFNTYAGVVTGAMGQDGSARAYIYPNRTGSIRINYILIRFA